VTPEGERAAQFTLHVSVAARWWLYHLPQAPEAVRFLRGKLGEPRSPILLAVQDIEAQIFEYVAKELGDDLDVLLAETIAADAIGLFDDLQESGVIQLLPTRIFLPPALVGAALHRIPFSDAVAVSLAEDSGAPLLVADDAVYRTLRALESVRPRLRVAWLSDQLD